MTPRRPAPRTSARTDLDAVWQRAQARFVLDYRHSIHGVAHWRRVQENGLRSGTASRRYKCPTAPSYLRRSDIIIEQK